jgi:hypothetical protein
VPRPCAFVDSEPEDADLLGLDLVVFVEERSGPSDAAAQAKLGVSSRTAAGAFAFEHDLVY